MLKNFLNDARGNVAMLFALSTVPLMGVVGLSIDYARATNTKENLQAAVDTAALSLAAAASSESQTELENRANLFVQTTFAPRFPGDLDPVVVERNAGTLTVRTATRQPTVIMHFFGRDDLVISAAPRRPSRRSAASNCRWRSTIPAPWLGQQDAGAEERFQRLLNDLEDLSTGPQPIDVKVAVVPFDTQGAREYWHRGYELAEI